MEQSPENQPSQAKTSACVWIAVIGCGGLVLLVLCPFIALIGVAAFWHETGENKDRPPMFYAEKGKNFSYDISYLHRYCEFDISETDFLDWCKSISWEPVEIETLPTLPKVDYDEKPMTNYRRETPLFTLRYCFQKPEHENCKRSVYSESECKHDPTGKTDKACYHRVDNGYYYEWRGDNGGGVYVLYDRDNGRCYIHANHH